MSKRLMPTYLVNFLKEIYDGTIPSNFGKRMVSRQFIARVKELYETLGGDNPSDYSRRMVNEYLIKFFNEIEIVEYTDDDVKMTKTISSDLVYPACRIDAIGGMSYKSENLINASDNTISNAGFILPNTVLPNDLVLGTYTISFNYTGGGALAIQCFNSSDTQAGTSTITGIVGTNTITFTTTDTTHYIRVYTNNSSGGTISNVMLVKGSTALPYEPYFEGIRDSAVTAVKTYNTDNDLLDTYTIPSAITSLEGYGQSNPDDPTVYNEVNFIDGKYYEKGYIDNGEWVTKVAEVTISENAPLLEVVEGGTIVFENEYNQNMPSEVTTWIKES